MKFRLLFAALSALLVSFPSFARWPEKPVRLVVPYAAGAMGDVIARLLAEEMRPKLGQPVIVDNRTGAGGNIGAAAVARAEPDGYTILVGATNNFVINQFLYRDMGFDPLQAFSPVTVLVEVPSVIFTSAEVPAKTFAEFVQYARANKGKLNFGSPGIGTTPHLSAALISNTRGLGMVHIPFKGSKPGFAALLANRVQYFMGGAGLGSQYVKAGKLRALAVSNARRLDTLPGTPTFEEAGLSDIKASNYWAVAVPKGAEAGLIRKVYKAFSAAIATPAARDRFAKLGVTPVGSTPAATAQRWREEVDYWGKAIKDMDVRIN